MEPENAAGYVLLSNIYIAASNMHLCESVEWQRKEKGAKKWPGCTWIEVNNEVHRFVVEDHNQPQMIEIYAELQRLSGLMHDTRGSNSTIHLIINVGPINQPYLKIAALGYKFCLELSCIIQQGDN
ncbi:unnamed protein product [Sphagnum balticum]